MGARRDSGDIAISYPESSGFLVSGATPGRLWGHRKNSIFLIGCSVTVSIVLPQKSCGNKIRCPQSLPGVVPLTKKPEDSGYEIGDIEKNQFFDWLFRNGSDIVKSPLKFICLSCALEEEKSVVTVGGEVWG